MIELGRKVSTDDKGIKVVEVYLDPKRRGTLLYQGYQWKFIGPWVDEDRDIVETVLLENNSGPCMSNHWELYDGTWGNMYRFIAKRYTWEYGPYCHGNTATDLAESIKGYYQKS